MNPIHRSSSHACIEISSKKENFTNSCHLKRSYSDNSLKDSFHNEAQKNSDELSKFITESTLEIFNSIKLRFTLTRNKFQILHNEIANTNKLLDAVAKHYGFSLEKNNTLEKLNNNFILSKTSQKSKKTNSENISIYEYKEAFKQQIDQLENFQEFKNFEMLKDFQTKIKKIQQHFSSTIDLPKKQDKNFDFFNLKYTNYLSVSLTKTLGGNAKFQQKRISSLLNLISHMYAQIHCFGPTANSGIEYINYFFQNFQNYHKNKIFSSQEESKEYLEKSYAKATKQQASLEAPSENWDKISVLPYEAAKEKILGNFTYVIIEEKGERPTMQDVTFAKIIEVINEHNDMKIPFFAIADGHGERGDYVAKVSGERLFKIMEETLRNAKCLDEQTVMQAIYSAYIKIQQELEADTQLKWAGGGTTLTACFIINNQLYTANLGDSEAILINNTHVKQLVPICSPKDRSEEIEVLLSGGDVEEIGFTTKEGMQYKKAVINKHSCGNQSRLFMTGSLGDIKYGYKIKRNPFITITNMDNLKDSFLMLYSDGLIASKKQIQKEILAMQTSNFSLSEMSSIIIQKANQLDSKDNISFILVKI